ncbi:MAG: hypothetical protein KBT04_06575 [Bacteroidales bacterium]|nr:hypothetical protein [Candidatus Colimorpha onthohippi]
MYQPESFWNWFTNHNEQLTMLGDLDADSRVKLLSEMQHQLEDYCPGLSFEMGEATPKGRTITFTAEGDTDLFRYVIDLTDNAPDLDWWDFVAFKPASGNNLKVRFDRYCFDTTKMHFMQLECEEEPDFIGLRIAVNPEIIVKGNAVKQPVNYDDEDLQVGVYVTIEAMIGEFDCATLIGYMETCPVPSEPFKSGFQPMDDLPKFVEWFKQKREK